MIFIMFICSNDNQKQYEIPNSYHFTEFIYFINNKSNNDINQIGIIKHKQKKQTFNKAKKYNDMNTKYHKYFCIKK